MASAAAWQAAWEWKLMMVVTELLVPPAPFDVPIKTIIIKNHICLLCVL
jgi:hypothetical protein